MLKLHPGISFVHSSVCSPGLASLVLVALVDHAGLHLLFGLEQG
jgi:hypothetical protein